MSIKIDIKIPLYPTEKRERVLRCIENLVEGKINDIKEEEYRDYKILTIPNVPVNILSRIFSEIRQKKILDTVRECIEIDRMHNAVIIYLHKQALYNNKIAIITSDTTSSLGYVELWIYTEDPDKVLDWLATKTIKGVEIEKHEFNEIFEME